MTTTRITTTLEGRRASTVTVVEDGVLVFTRSREPSLDVVFRSPEASLPPSLLAPAERGALSLRTGASAVCMWYLDL